MAYDNWSDAKRMRLNSQDNGKKDLLEGTMMHITPDRIYIVRFVILQMTFLSVGLNYHEL